MSIRQTSEGPAIGASGQAHDGRVPISWLSASLCILAVNGFVVLYLWVMGRPFVAPHEPFQLFSASLSQGDNSLHLSDPYSLSHAIFGMGLFLFIDWMKPHWFFGRKLLVAILGSAFWEVVENTPFVVDLFNDPAQGDVYRGDSIVNSLSDTLFVALGFVFASRVRWPVVVAVAVVLEIVVSLWIHDGLILGTLKVLGLQ
ncbi:DUF2585 family protein [Fulvimarina endophytica]|uniref:DUF2585 family protein n=1 Tax=Fulvimarina endophytica TaxID=2293836 RepID=A0A371X7W0_9HYPH|nr:DUF2585 family protein [Fulvimarina endophytica]RFC65307.1 DUF2585 family protein [Fulvimarina endophytica]